jgi:hypothetical protein
MRERVETAFAALWNPAAPVDGRDDDGRRRHERFMRQLRGEAPAGHDPLAN